ncbi:MAG: FG-GAP-like repeat-containing protein, partial [Candidatus Freyarchaeota archaeon]
MVRCCYVGDVDGDGRKEVVAGSMDNTLRVLREGGKLGWKHRFRGLVRCCYVGDVDGDGKNEIV